MYYYHIINTLYVYSTWRKKVIYVVDCFRLPPEKKEHQLEHICNELKYETLMRPREAC